MKSDREEFEKWASALPRDLNINRLSASASWPEQYESYTVETAWEAWQAARQQAVPIVMPPSPYMPDTEPGSMTAYEEGEAQGRCDMWAEVKRLNAAAPQAEHMLSAPAPAERVEQEPVAWMLADAVGGSMVEFQKDLLLIDQCRYGGQIVPLYAAPQPTPAPQPSEGVEQESDDYPECDYCGVVPDHHPWHGSGMLEGVESRHIHACDQCRGKLQAPPAPDVFGVCMLVAEAAYKAGCGKDRAVRADVLRELVESATLGTVQPAPDVSGLELFAKRAIGICEGEASEWDSDDLIAQKNYAQACANRIRRLRDEFLQAHQNREG